MLTRIFSSTLPVRAEIPIRHSFHSFFICTFAEKWRNCFHIVPPDFYCVLHNLICSWCAHCAYTAEIARENGNASTVQCPLYTHRNLAN